MASVAFWRLCFLWGGSQAVADCPAGAGRHGTCLSVVKDGSTGETMYGLPDQNNFCNFALNCFGLKCPFRPGAPEFPLGDLPAEELLFHDRSGEPSACEQILAPECAAEYEKAYFDCAKDPRSISIWEGRASGLCPRCQKIVKAYRHLHQACQELEGRDFSLERLQSDFLERSGQDALWRSDITAEL
eukprot:gb/GFBE01073834.1/.p1 GENE.gb/GFBE01073834.1/~~gb/GFBE01073834.1/.p1  ORF type:complete len:187 (+),score=32.61 gb/GFBE01073834.1/:1-561(+)